MFILQAVGFALLGLAVIVSATFGLAYFIGTLDKHHPNCTCNACQIRRQKEWRARNPDKVVSPNEPHKPRKWRVDDKRQGSHLRSGVWLSTVELRPGMKVLGRDRATIYVVDEVLPWSHGYSVKLTNVLTKVNSMVPVPTDRAMRKIWLVRTPPGRIE